jgi:preprotein translocase SecE subunit
MAVGIYKKGQGYWTRLMSAIAYGMLVLMGAVWLWKLLAGIRVGDLEPVYVQAIGAVIVLAVFGYLGYQLIGRRPKVVDFMIATEGEMKKVNWSTRREILGSTWVVIGLTMFIAVYCFGFDLIFNKFFQFIGVLDAG